MKRSQIVVPWPEGLHLRPASRLTRVAQKFQSTILLRCGEKLADLRSILSVIALCATMGTTLDLQVTGDDESDAAAAVEAVFAADDNDAPEL